MKVRLPAFTLAELLIALSILGVIATFTIPKVLGSQSDSRNKAIVKEAAATVSEMYQAYKLKNVSGAGTTWDNLIPYLNYVRQDTSTIVDSHPANGNSDCSASWFKCYRLHNGAMIYFDRSDIQSFGGTGDLNYLGFTIDPDGKESDVKAVELMLYYNGMIRSRGTMKDNSTNSLYPDVDACGACEPNWFTWN